MPRIDGAGTRVLAAVFVHDALVAEGEATSARYAKLKASENGLLKLEGMPPFRFREKYGCDCHMNQNGVEGEKADESD